MSTHNKPKRTKCLLHSIQRSSFLLWMSIFSLMLTFTFPSTSQAQPDKSGSDFWVTAYLASWNHFAPPGGNWGNLPTDAIDWDAITHLNYFALNVKENGSLSTIKDYENMSPDRINAVVKAAHQAGVPVLITIGGWGNYEGFSNAITPQVRSRFIEKLVQTLRTWKFDGIDLDMEPIEDSDVRNYTAFINALYNRLQNVATPLLDQPLLTVATDWQPEMFAEIQDKIDQINLMTYDFSGPWGGWVTWHNAALYSAEKTFPGRNKLLPSAHNEIQEFIQAGVSSKKLGLGIDFYGYIWKGVSEPGEGWTFRAPEVEDNVPYHIIMDKYFQPNFYHWDTEAQAAYLSIERPNEKLFITYDNEKTIDAKVEYARNQNLGGVIIWELSGGFRENQPPGERDQLLQKVKQTVKGSK